MIRVHIQNFQSIDDLEFEVDGFTTLAGKSNIGKSAVIRAVSAALLNLPVTGMVRTGASHCTVHLVGPSYDIKWEKGEKGINRYTINGKVFDKVGAKAIPEIEALGFKQVEVGSSWETPWFASQFSPIFLLDKSGSQVTEFISEVSRLGVLQDAISRSNKGKKQNADTASARQAEIKSLETKMSVFVDLPQVTALSEDLEAMATSIEECESKYSAWLKQQAKTAVATKQVDALENPLSLAEVPEQVQFPSELLSMDRLSKSIMQKTQQLGAVSDSEKYQVPAVPGLDEFAKISLLERAGAVSQRVSRINTDIRIPDAPDDLVSKLQYMEEAKSKLDRIRSRIPLSTPDIAQDPHVKLDELEKMVAIVNRLRSESSAIRDLKSQLDAVNAKCTEIDQQLSSISICPACDRPV